jgi:hypothetical protein
LWIGTRWNSHADGVPDGFTFPGNLGVFDLALQRFGSVQDIFVVQLQQKEQNLFSPRNAQDIPGPEVFSDGMSEFLQDTVSSCPYVSLSALK